MPYINPELRKLGCTVENRLRGTVPPEDIYPLVYLASEARNSVHTTDAGEAIKAVANGDDDLIETFEAAFGRISPKTTFEELVGIVSGLNKADLDSYLENGPMDQGMNEAVFTTPRGIAELALAILNIRPDDRVVDFGCGRGTFLEAAASECPEAKLVGVDIYRDALAIAKIRSRMTGSSVSYIREDMFHFYENNVAGSPVNKAFSNYPWGMRTMTLPRESEYVYKVISGQERYSRPFSSDWVYNRLLVDSLEEDGIAIGIMSNGACFNGTDKPARRYFVNNGFIKAVIALPKGVFAPYAMIQTSLVVLCAGGCKGVRIVDASDLGTNDRRSCVITDADIKVILERLETDSDKSSLKTIDELAARSFDLSAKRYLQNEIKVPNGTPLSNVAKIQRGASVRAADLDALVCEQDTGISYLNLGNISDGSIDDELPNLSALDPKLEKYCIQDGDVLISKNGAPFKVAVAEVPEGRKILANGNLYAVRVNREMIDPYYLAAFFSSPSGKELLSREAVGTAIPNMPVSALSRIMVPLEEPERQKTVAAAYLAKTDEIKVLKLRLSRARQEIADLFEEEA
ncbi:N-6 DNA methylase [uncultured Parolsenella sp.]|uniref:N-6 DNA methylase n=1 Tax=uncultured Parolsenella sp. TaxID=2083008 RepID=UPI0025CD157C|nr:N-6 DNA methylase [uncultured Parolsenella sp.]